LSNRWYAVGRREHRSLNRHLERLIARRKEQRGGRTEGTGTEHVSELNSRLDDVIDKYWQPYRDEAEASQRSIYRTQQSQRNAARQRDRMSSRRRDYAAFVDDEAEEESERSEAEEEVVERPAVVRAVEGAADVPTAAARSSPRGRSASRGSRRGRGGGRNRVSSSSSSRVQSELVPLVGRLVSTVEIGLQRRQEGDERYERM